MHCFVMEALKDHFFTICMQVIATSLSYLTDENCSFPISETGALIYIMYKLNFIVTYHCNHPTRKQGL